MISPKMENYACDLMSSLSQAEYSKCVWEKSESFWLLLGEVA